MSDTQSQEEMERDEIRKKRAALRQELDRLDEEEQAISERKGTEDLPIRFKMYAHGDDDGDRERLVREIGISSKLADELSLEGLTYEVEFHFELREDRSVWLVGIDTHEIQPILWRQPS